MSERDMPLLEVTASYFFLQVFVDFSLQILYMFFRFIPKHFIFVSYYKCYLKKFQPPIIDCYSIKIEFCPHLF